MTGARNMLKKRQTGGRRAMRWKGPCSVAALTAPPSGSPACSPMRYARNRCVLGIPPCVKSLRSSYTRLHPQMRRTLCVRLSLNHRRVFPQGPAPPSGSHILRCVIRARTRHTLEQLAWHWSHWPGRLVNRQLLRRPLCVRLPSQPPSCLPAGTRPPLHRQELFALTRCDY